MANSTTRRNVKHIENEVGYKLEMEKLATQIETISSNLKFADIPEGQVWRISAHGTLRLFK